MLLQCPVYATLKSMYPSASSIIYYQQASTQRIVKPAYFLSSVPNSFHYVFCDHARIPTRSQFSCVHTFVWCTPLRNDIHRNIKAKQWWISLWNGIRNTKMFKRNWNRLYARETICNHVRVHLLNCTSSTCICVQTHTHMHAHTHM